MRFLPSCPGVQRIGSLLIRKGQGKSWKPGVAVGDDGLLTGCCKHPFTDGGDYGTAQTVSIGAAQAASKSRT